MEGTKLSNFKVGNQAYKMMKIERPKLQLNQYYLCAHPLSHTVDSKYCCLETQLIQSIVVWNNVNVGER
jgi:hypothetical protein